MTKRKKVTSELLHIGCGNNYFEGWLNCDLDTPGADINHDVRTKFPFTNRSFTKIYNEHFIEHLTQQEGLFVFKEFFRLLKPGGVVRIATLDLDYLVFKYLTNWKSQDWIKTYHYEWIHTKAEMLNTCFREWEHKYLYNKEEMTRILVMAGFKQENIKRCVLQKSEHSEFKGRETRKDSKLILEAVKV